jgi:hypothetical protein
MPAAYGFIMGQKNWENLTSDMKVRAILYPGLFFLIGAFLLGTFIYDYICERKEERQ